MNRAEMTRRVLLLEAAAGQCKARAATLRTDMEAAALAELNEQGMRPVWELRDVGTWTLPLSEQAVYVADDAALLAWVKAQPATDLSEIVETVERLRSWWVADLLRLVRVVDGQAIDQDGTIVPGLAVRPGGVPKTLQFRADALAKQVAGDAAGELVDRLAAGLGIEPSGIPDGGDR